MADEGQSLTVTRFGRRFKVICTDGIALINLLDARVSALVAQLQPAKSPEDPVNHPSHYTEHPSGVERNTISEHMTFCVGNAIKYLWRAGKKGPPIQDLEKARYYIDREIVRLERELARAASETTD